MCGALWLERTEGYVDKFPDHEPLNAGDVLVAYSHGGRNSAAIEAALYAEGTRDLHGGGHIRRKRGTPGRALLGTTPVDRVRTSRSTPARPCRTPSSRSRAGAARVGGGTSTVVACVVSHELITRAATVLAERGHVVPTFVSPTVPGASLSSNDEVFSAHRRLMHEAEGRAIS